ncbi:tRNA pseudouridine synthase B [Commensalibacter sp. Nvir]|uniref:tRNA pseudouridine(55) synthase TruB n=1 Tax=Commensalibacter sp. Nvir TaxID=3069817 RepID=UPI002D291F62|nr:tRNA pseudouridine synthase B [Commensalibacter sp. Nvir]
MRKQRGQKIDGWLLIDKPLGVTSAYVVNRVKFAFDAQKVGHSGTLDPLASGMLPIALGKATKTISYIMDKPKTYQFILCFGERRSTDDAEGEVLERSHYRPSTVEIEEALKQFQGRILQIPPIFSAIKVNGRRSYDLARQGMIPELSKRPARIDSFRLLERLDEDCFLFEVISGKGVYMRSLARDLAAACHSVGYISYLRRLVVGPFEVDKAIMLDHIVGNGKRGEASLDMILPVETVLNDISALALTSEEATDLGFGRKIAVEKLKNQALPNTIGPNQIIRVVEGKRCIGLCRLENEWLRPVCIF